MFSKISLATVLVEAFLLILTTTIILVIGLLRIMSMRTRKNSQSSHYDKLWVHTNQSPIGFSSNACRRKNKVITGNKRDYENKKLTFLTQSPQSYENWQETEHIKSLENVVFQNLTFASKQQEQEIELRKNENAPSQTFVDVETVSLRNGKGLYDVTSQIPMETTKAEEGNKLTQMVKFTSPNKVPMKQGNVDYIEQTHIEVACHGTSESVETPDSDNEDTMTQTCEEGAVAQGGEYDDTVLEKKPRIVEGVDEIYDVFENQGATRNDSKIPCVETYAVHTIPVVPRVDAYAVCSLPTISKGPVSANNEGSKSSEYEQQSDEDNKPPPAPVDFDSIEDIYVEVGTYSPEADTSDSEGIEDEETMTRNSQENVECGEYDVIAMNRRIKKPRNIGDVEEIYDVVVNQLATGKDSSSKIQHLPTLPSSTVHAHAVTTVPKSTVQTNAVTTVPTSTVQRVHPYAVCTVPALSKIAKNAGADDKDAAFSQ